MYHTRYVESVVFHVQLIELSSLNVLKLSNIHSHTHTRRYMYTDTGHNEYTPSPSLPAVDDTTFQLTSLHQSIYNTFAQKTDQSEHIY